MKGHIAHMAKIDKQMKHNPAKIATKTINHRSTIEKYRMVEPESWPLQPETPTQAQEGQEKNCSLFLARTP